MANPIVDDAPAAGIVSASGTPDPRERLLFGDHGGVVLVSLLLVTILLVLVTGVSP